VTTASLKRTPLYEAHVEAGAKLVPFAGFEMPVQYDGIRAEHLAVRTHAGVFDVSHMGEIETEGPQALECLQRLLSNDVSKIQLGGAQYSCLCRGDGGVLDDLFTYRLDEDHYLTVTNASNHEADLEWFATVGRDFDVHIRDVADRWAMLAVQGPRARQLVTEALDVELPQRMHAAHVHICGALAVACGTGYTGEEGVELLIAPHVAAEAWAKLLNAGVVPVGLGARDTLRLEVCFPLYGNDLSTERTPIEARLGWCCVEETGFIGSDAVAKVRADGPEELLAPFELTGEGIPRQGNDVVLGDEVVGVVTSGTLSPSLDRGVGMAYVRTDLAEPGTELEIDVRGRRRAAQVKSKPLYEK
jgi:aminomethyltransferase